MKRFIISAQHFVMFLVWLCFCIIGVWSLNGYKTVPMKVPVYKDVGVSLSWALIAISVFGAVYAITSLIITNIKTRSVKESMEEKKINSLSKERKNCSGSKDKFCRNCGAKRSTCRSCATKRDKKVTEESKEELGKECDFAIGVVGFGLMFVIPVLCLAIASCLQHYFGADIAEIVFYPLFVLIVGLVVFVVKKIDENL